MSVVTRCLGPQLAHHLDGTSFTTALIGKGGVCLSDILCSLTWSQHDPAAHRCRELPEVASIRILARSAVLILWDRFGAGCAMDGPAGFDKPHSDRQSTALLGG